MKRSWLVVLLSLWSLTNTRLAGESVSLTSDDLPRLIREKNQNVTGAKLLTKASEFRTGHLARSYLPHLSAEMGGERFKTGGEGPRTEPYGKAEAKVNLYRGGRDALEEEVRKGQVRISDALEKRTYANELSEARKIYWTLVFQKELTELSKKSEEANQKNLSSAIQRIDRGLATPSDRLEFEIKQSQIQEEMDTLELEIALGEKQLRALLAMPSETRFKTPKRLSVPADQEYLSMKLSPVTHPEVFLLGAQKDISFAQKRQSDRWWLPSVDLYSEYSLYTQRDREYPSQKDRDDHAVGLKFSFDLFDGFRSKSESSASSAQAAAYENQGLQRARMLDAQFQGALQRMKHLRNRLVQAEKQTERGKEYYRRSLEEYDLGVKNSLDILSSTDRYLSLSRRYIELKKDYHFARFELLELIGK